MHEHHYSEGIANITIAILGAVISIANIQAMVSIVAGTVAIISGISAARYYILQGNEIIKKRKKS